MARLAILWGALALGWLAAGRATLALAAEIKVPLTIDYVTLREALIHQLYNAGGQRADLWNGANSCQYFYAENPRFAQGAAGIKLETDGTLNVGVPVGERCVSPLSWQGIIEIDAAPYLAPNLRLMFRVTNLNLYNARHQKTLIAGHGFDLIKQYFIPRFQTFSFDFGPALDEFRTLAAEISPPAAAARLQDALATIRGVPPLTATADGVQITLAINAPEAAAASAPVASSAPLTTAELAAWDARLDQWDAFMVFAVKQLGSTIGDKQIRTQLFDLLLGGRYRMVQALNQPPQPGVPDPARVLFFEEWRQLREIVHAAALRGQLGDRAIEFLSFISAGDALMAFDEAAPELGVQISAADLRRLARIMAPETTADPLQFDYQVDPELQRIFGIVPPPEGPDSLEPSGADGATSILPGGTPALPSSFATPSASPAAPPKAPVAPTGSAPHDRPSLAWSFFPTMLRSAAWAAAFAAPPPQPSQFSLWRAVVSEKNVQPYQQAMDALLSASAGREIAAAGFPLPPPYATLVKATAWQESCWRQFVMAGGSVWYLNSRTGDIGLMQINKHVWRGLYSISHLEWDISYNAAAGAQILAQLIQRAARTEPGTGAAMARSAYAGYNGGPDELDRWRHSGEPPNLRMVDDDFWEKYRALAAGQPIDILRCAAAWSH